MKFFADNDNSSPWATGSGMLICCTTPDALYLAPTATEDMFTQVPAIAPDTWIAPNAVLVGDVDLFDKVGSLLQLATGVSFLFTDSNCGVQTSIWYGCVLRGDLNSIRIGAFSNVQDKTVMHAAR